MQATFYHGSIIIIESLKDDDKKTGKMLHNTLIADTKCSLKNTMPFIKIRYEGVTSSNELLNLLEEIYKSDEYKCPVIHIEAHGGNDGGNDGGYFLECTDGSILTCEELAEPLRRINEKSGLNLLLSMATCHGLDMECAFVSAFCQDRIIPFVALVGSNYDEHSDSIEDFFLNFFRLYFNGNGAASEKHTDVNTVMSTLNRQFPHFKIIDTLKIIAITLKRYWDLKCTPEAKEQRLKNIKEIAVRESGIIVSTDSLSDIAHDFNLEEKSVNDKISHLLGFCKIEGNRERFKNINYLGVISVLVPKLGKK